MALDSAKNVACRLADAPSAEAKWRELRRLHVSSPSFPSPLVKFAAADLNIFYSSTVSHHPLITERDFDLIANQPFSLPPNHLFCLRPFSSHEVADALQHSSSNATGHDGLSLPMIKLTLSDSLPLITNLFNISIATATFPPNWKKLPFGRSLNQRSCPSSQTRDRLLSCPNSPRFLKGWFITSSRAI